MFERFTDDARQVILFARDEIRMLRHEQISVEHLLVGLVRVEEGAAARVLKSLDLTLDIVRRRVIEMVGVGEAVAPSQISFTPAAKKVFERALREVLARGENYIAAEDILLALVGQHDDVATSLLVKFGADPERVRGSVLDLLRAETDSRPVRELTSETQISLEPPEGGVAPELFERFTDAAREVIAVAEEQSLSLKHGYVSTEHLLLGLLSVTDGVAARVLESSEIMLEQVRDQLEPRSGSCRERPRGHMRLLSVTKRALERAGKQAQPGKVDTEHILLGLIAVNDSLGPRLLLDLGVFPEGLRNVIAETVEAGLPPKNAAQVARTRPRLAQDDHVTWGFQEAIDLAHHEAVMRGNTHVSLDDLLLGVLQVDEGWPVGEDPRGRLLEGAWPLAGTLLTEIEDRLGRPLDAGDLLVLLASVPGGFVSEALSSLAVDAAALAQALDKARSGGARSELLWPTEVVPPNDDARAARESATSLETLAESRDDLRNQTDAARTIIEQRRHELLRELRSRLGLAT
jgi:hypothetical protein